MSLALFHATLRRAVRDALADDRECWSAATARGETSTATARADKVRRLRRSDLVVHDAYDPTRRAP